LTILLTGVTGQVGGAALRALDVPVRVLTRSAVSVGGDAELVVGSFDDAPSLRGAVDGRSMQLAQRGADDRARRRRVDPTVEHPVGERIGFQPFEHEGRAVDVDHLGNGVPPFGEESHECGLRRSIRAVAVGAPDAVGPVGDDIGRAAHADEPVMCCHAVSLCAADASPFATRSMLSAVAFHFVLDASRPLLETQPDAAPGSLEQQVATLRRDYGRATRLLVGIGVTLVGMLVLFTTAGVVASFGFDSPAIVILLLPLIALAAAVAWVLVRLHRSGRRLSIALAARLRARSEGGRGWNDAILARTFIFEPFVFWRIAIAALAVLGGVIFVSMVFSPGAARDLALAVAFAAIGMLLLAVGCGVFGGVFRVNLAHSRRDPVQHRILGG